MENSYKSTLLIISLPLILIFALSTNLIPSAEASRSPAIEKSDKPLKAAVYSYLVRNGK